MLNLDKNYPPQRLGTNSEKWDGVKARFGEEGLLPLWVADMDFRAPDAVPRSACGSPKEHRLPLP